MFTDSRTLIGPVQACSLNPVDLSSGVSQRPVNAVRESPRGFASMRGKITSLHPRPSVDERSDLAERIQQLREQRRANVNEFKTLCSEAQRLRSEAREIRARSRFVKDQVAGIQQQLLNGGLQFRTVWGFNFNSFATSATVRNSSVVFGGL